MKQSIRGSDVFVKEDIRSVLQALLATNETIGQMVGVVEYRKGFASAIAAVATAFDIKLEKPNVFNQGEFYE